MGILPFDNIKGYSPLGHVLISQETGKPCLVTQRTIHKIIWPQKGRFRSLQNIINGLKIVKTETFNIEYDNLQELGEQVGNEIYGKKGYIDQISFEPLEGYRNLQSNELNEFIGGFMRSYISN